MSLDLHAAIIRFVVAFFLIRLLHAYSNSVNVYIEFVYAKWYATAGDN